jgi:hypothetical protein
MALAMLMDYTAIIAACLILADGMLFSRKEEEKKRSKKPWITLLYPLAGIVIYLLVRIWFSLQNARYGSPSESGGEFFQYVKNITPLGEGFKPISFLSSVGEHLASLYTWPVLLLFVMGCLMTLGDLFHFKPVRWKTRFILILTAFGAANIVIFARHAQGHDYWVILLYPGALWCAAAAMERLAGLAFRSHEGKLPKGGLVIVSLFALSLILLGVGTTLDTTKERLGREDFRLKGFALKELATKGELVITLERPPVQVVYYSQGTVFPYSPGLSPDGWMERLGGVLSKIQQFGLREHPKIFVLDRVREREAGEVLKIFREELKEERNERFIFFREKRDG